MKWILDALSLWIAIVLSILSVKFAIVFITTGIIAWLSAEYVSHKFYEHA